MIYTKLTKKKKKFEKFVMKSAVLYIYIYIFYPTLNNALHMTT